MQAAQGPQRLRLDQDFENGALDCSTSRIDTTEEGAPGRPVVTLQPRRTWQGHFWWVRFRLHGAVGTQPLFRLDLTGLFGKNPAAQRFVFCEDGQEWRFFLNAKVFEEGGTAWYEFAPASPFTTETVDIAWGLPYTMAMLDEHVRELQGDPWVHPTRSSGPDLVLTRTPGTEKGGYRDDCGRAVGSQNVYAYVITDGASEARRNVVLMAGNHPAETPGDLILRGMVDFLRSDAPEAAVLRRMARFFVYPNTNPEGRAAGYFRSNPENPTIDHNRCWTNPAGFSDVKSIAQAIVTDTQGPSGRPSIEYLMDFHSCWDPGIEGGIFNIVRLGHEELPYVRAIERRHPGLWTKTHLEAKPGSTMDWAYSAQVGAACVIVPEPAFVPGAGYEYYFDLGRKYALALWDVWHEAGE